MHQLGSPDIGPVGIAVVMEDMVLKVSLLFRMYINRGPIKVSVWKVKNEVFIRNTADYITKSKKSDEFLSSGEVRMVHSPI